MNHEQILRRGLRLSTVPRWSVIPTIQKQTVSEHVHRGLVVINYFERCIIRRKLQTSRTIIDQARRVWLGHDDDEAITGDKPSNSKIRGDDTNESSLYHFIKTVDCGEALVFLAEEFFLGNQHAGPGSPLFKEINTKAKRHEALFTKKSGYTESPLMIPSLMNATLGFMSSPSLHPGMEADND